MDEKEIRQIHDKCLLSKLRGSETIIQDIRVGLDCAAAELAALFDQKLTVLSRCLKTETDRADKYQARLAERDGRVLWEHRGLALVEEDSCWDCDTSPASYDTTEIEGAEDGNEFSLCMARKVVGIEHGKYYQVAVYRTKAPEIGKTAGND